MKNNANLNRKNKLSGVSLFSSAGIGESYLSSINIDIKVANELIQNRANLYRHLHPNTIMVTGDITDKNVFNEILKKSKGQIDFLLATPPCQGVKIGRASCRERV